MFDLNDVKVSKNFNSLKNIKENYRNYYAHGGFEKRGASLYFHFPGLGALPALLSNIKEKPHFSFFPVEEDEYKKINNVTLEKKQSPRQTNNRMQLRDALSSAIQNVQSSDRGEMKKSFNKSFSKSKEHQQPNQQKTNKETDKDTEISKDVLEKMLYVKKPDENK